MREMNDNKERLANKVTELTSQLDEANNKRKKLEYERDDFVSHISRLKTENKQVNVQVSLNDTLSEMTEANKTLEKNLGSSERNASRLMLQLEDMNTK